MNLSCSKQESQKEVPVENQEENALAQDIQVQKKDLALVLCGGGAKGAYQVGVWKAMEEYGLTKRVAIISGTSVGALNAALFSSTDLNTAEQIWKKDVRFDTFLMFNAQSLKQLISYIYDSARKAGKSEYSIIEFAMSSLGDIYSYFLGDQPSPGLFDRTSLNNIIDQHVSLEKIQNSGMEVYVTCVRKDNLTQKLLMKNIASESSAHYFKLNEQVSDSNVKGLLTASSALPIAYPSVKLPADVIENSTPVGQSFEYIDGGFEMVGGDNSPFVPTQGRPDIKTTIAVYLFSKAEMGIKALRPYSEDFPVLQIVPSEDLGDVVFGVVNFEQEQLKRLMDLGYKDACLAFNQAGLKSDN